jgi:hypothetical protein
MSVADSYATLPVYRYRAHFRSKGELRLPAERRSAVLRGAFGITLRKLVCHDLTLDCAACPLRKACAYPAVFDPGATTDQPALRRYADPPRPFVIRTAEFPTPERVEPGADLVLDVHVVGAAQRQAPFLLATLARLAQDGLGPRRVPLELRRVDALDAHGEGCGIALDGPAAVMRPTASPAVRAGELLRAGDQEASRVRLRFLAATLLREGGSGVDTPRFGVVMRRLRARLGALATLFGDGAFADDPKALAKAAEGIAMNAADTEWARETRRSSRTGQRHWLEGFTGEASYEGALGSFMPLLRLGELLHVGKHASFGLGRFEVAVVTSLAPR